MCVGSCRYWDPPQLAQRPWRVQDCAKCIAFSTWMHEFTRIYFVMFANCAMFHLRHPRDSGRTVSKS